MCCAENLRNPVHAVVWLHAEYYPVQLLNTRHDADQCASLSASMTLMAHAQLPRPYRIRHCCCWCGCCLKTGCRIRARRKRVEMRCCRDRRRFFCELRIFLEIHFRQFYSKRLHLLLLMQSECHCSLNPPATRHLRTLNRGENTLSTLADTLSYSYSSNESSEYV